MVILESIANLEQCLRHVDIRYTVIKEDCPCNILLYTKVKVIFEEYRKMCFSCYRDVEYAIQTNHAATGREDGDGYKQVVKP